MKNTSTAWSALASLPAYLITSIPRPASQSAPDTAHAQRAAALTAAWHTAAGGAAGFLAIGWIRQAEGSPVNLLAAGHLLPAAQSGEQVMLTLPAGAHGHLLPPGGFSRLLAALPCWQPIAGISDGLLTDGVQDQPPMPGLALEDCLLPAWTGPFGWLVAAEPLSPAAVAGMADGAARDGHVAAITTGRHPDHGPQARRLHLRHAELRRGLSAGMWRLRIAAGAATPHDAARVAGLACGASGLAGLPYLVTLAGEPQAGISQLLSARVPSHPGSDRTAGYPFDASTGLLAALARPPATEIPGVRLTLLPGFDVTPEHASPASSGRAGHAAAVTIGQVLDRGLMPAGPLIVPLESLNRHVLVCGATGAGKSQTVRALLEAATAAGIPWLVIEPAKAEYRAMAARLAPSGVPVVRIRPGEPDGIPAGLNPLEPAPGPDGIRFPLQTHADLTRALFLAAFRAEDPFPQVLSAALARVYEETGWDLALGEPASGASDLGYPGLTALHRAAEQVVTEIGYSQRVTDDVLGFVRIRLASLRHGTTGRFLEGGHRLDFTRLLEHNVVLEIEDIGDDQDKAFLTGAVLIRIAEHLRITRRAGCQPAAGLAHLTVIEEAHRLLRHSDSAAGAAAQATEMFAALLAEIRAYGEGLIIAEQIPVKLISDVIKNTAVKITHRLPAADDRQAVGATMNMTKTQSRYLVTLPPGHAAVFIDGMDHPVLARMPDGTSRETAPTPASTPEPVIQPRSITCGSGCAARPCTLREMRAAQRALHCEPALALWAELTVLAHLTGWAMPVPRPPLLDQLRAMPVRLRDCAISHAADTAIAARTPVIASRVSPPALAAHAADTIRARIEHGHLLCAREELRWLAPAYQWALVLDALTEAHRADPAAGRHPRSNEWEHAYGQAIPGPTIARQAATVQAWQDQLQRDTAELRIIAFGSARSSPIEQATGTSRDDDAFSQRLGAQLRQFTACHWPEFYLTGQVSCPPGQARQALPDAR